MTDIVRILHVGDLHSSDVPTEMIEFNRCRAAIAGCGRIDLIIATGDLGDKGNAESLAIGFKRLHAIRDAASKEDSSHGMTCPPVVVTPGNHDVLWPHSLDNPKQWTSHDRYRMFVSLFDDDQYAKFTRPLTIAHPLVTIEEALEYQPTMPWFYLLSRIAGPDVFVFPLSSVDLSGTPIIDRSPELYHGLRPQSHKRPLFHILTTRAKEHIRDNVIKVAEADIPFVDMGQLDLLEGLIQRWRDTSSESFDRFCGAVKIAAIHHPLMPVCSEQEIRSYDTVANGSLVLARLSRCGFHLVLYGHKHKLGWHVNYGLWEESGSANVGQCSPEVAGIAGGHMHTGHATGSKEHAGFQVVELSPSQEPLQANTKISLSTFAEQVGWRQPETLLTLDRGGHTRWIHHGDDAHVELSRNAEVMRTFATVVQRIETDYCQAQQAFRNEYGSADELIKESLNVMQKFSEGTQGVESEFVTNLLNRADTARAMYFVDLDGYGAWLQSNLLWHLVGLFKAFVTRNYARIRTGASWARGGWQHFHEVQEARVRLEHPPESRMPTNTVTFDLARVLVWRKSHIIGSPGRTLVKLHELFDIPLFVLEPADWDETIIEVDKLDFHIEWDMDDSQSDVAFNSPDGARVFPYNRITKTRVPVERAHECDLYLRTYKRLLSHEKLQLASKVAEL